MDIYNIYDEWFLLKLCDFATQRMVGHLKCPNQDMLLASLVISTSSLHFFTVGQKLQFHIPNLLTESTKLSSEQRPCWPHTSTLLNLRSWECNQLRLNCSFWFTWLSFDTFDFIRWKTQEMIRSINDIIESGINHIKFPFWLDYYSKWTFRQTKQLCFHVQLTRPRKALRNQKK